MKNKLLFFKMLLLVAFVATWTSCSKSDDIEANDPKPVNPTPTNPTNPTDKTDPKDDPYMVVCEHVAEVGKDVTVYYNKSKTLSDMERYIDDIKKIEYVQDAYASGTELFVEIKDYGMISFSFDPEPLAEQSERTRQSLKKNIQKHLPTSQYPPHPSLFSKKIAIISHVHSDDTFKEAREINNFTRDMFEWFRFDISPHVIEPDVEFFRNEIFNYDVVYLLTHGGFNSVRNFYTFRTSEQPPNPELLDPNTIFNKYNEDTPTDQVYFSTAKERRNGKEVILWYARVTDKWIDSDSTKFFPNPYNSIVFNGMCQSMKGTNPETRDSISYRVAKIFTDKGAGVYLGYDESNTVGHLAGCFFLHKLYSGMSIERAYEDLPFELKHDFRNEFDKDGNVTRTYWADLITYYTPKDSRFGISRMWDPFLNIDYLDQSTEKELKIILQEKAHYSYTFFSKDGNTKDYQYSKVIPSGSPIRYGFYLGESDQIKDSHQICSLGVGSKGFEQNGFGNDEKWWVSFQFTLNDDMLKPGTTYYYWAYFFDGKEYYNGQRHSFTTRSLNGSISGSGQGNLPNVPGSDL